MSSSKEGAEALSSGESISWGGKVAGELRMFKNGISLSSGDIGSLSQLFFDNLATLLGTIFAIQNMQNFTPDLDPNVVADVVWGKIVPGVGITFVIGNIFYSWQAIRLTNKWKRPYTAQPYGLNTPAAFAFVYNIMYPVFFANLDALGADDAFLLSYNVALAANFITAIILLCLGAVGPLILKTVPPAALLVPIAGIGIAFLGLEQLTNSIAAPIVGYMCVMWVYIGWYSGVQVGYGFWKLPQAGMVVLVGVVLGWATGVNKPQAVKDAAQIVGWWGPKWLAGDLFANFSAVTDYLGIVIPIGISAAASSLMCLVSAKQAGDPFPVRQSMMADGIGCMIGSFFGSPFGSVIYIGHPAHKRNGAKVGYSLINGILYLFLSWFGILALMQSIVNPATIGPIVFFVGLAVNEEALNFLPTRHYAAYIIGLFPSIYDWVVNISGRSPLFSESEDGVAYNSAYPSGTGGFIGVLAWKRGSLLVSMVWSAMVVMTLDRKWIMASVWAMVAATFAAVGLIHVPEAGFESFSEPTWEQCDLDFDGVPQCWQYAEQWMFFVAYLTLWATFLLLWFFYRNDENLPVIDDPTAHAFDDWFAEAAIDTSLHGVSRHKRMPGEKDQPPPEDDDEFTPVGSLLVDNSIKTLAVGAYTDVAAKDSEDEDQEEEEAMDQVTGSFKA